VEIVDKYKRLNLRCMAFAFIPMYNYTTQGKEAINAVWRVVGRGIVYRLELHSAGAGIGSGA
jgi:hypothetical protein